ncbi:hypothetical protein PMI02_03726 [Novosphingobium sp. AP12]|nr:hypothetical protein PMI02_03726 [Novosphingobium sp. AP12]
MITFSGTSRVAETVLEVTDDAGNCWTFAAIQTPAPSSRRRKRPVTPRWRVGGLHALTHQLLDRRQHLASR